MVNEFRPSLAIRIARGIAVGWMAISIVTPSAQAAPADIDFSIDGVGRGMFTDVILSSEGETAPGPDSSHPCLELRGGSPANGPQLLKWMKSNDASAALASHPDATLTVTTGRAGGLKEGTYHLSDITIAAVREKANRDVTNVWLDGAEINCRSLEKPT